VQLRACKLGFEARFTELELPRAAVLVIRTAPDEESGIDERIDRNE
jgi:hypothetical protein